jgi:hypothetical protein
LARSADCAAFKNSSTSFCEDFTLLNSSSDSSSEHSSSSSSLYSGPESSFVSNLPLSPFYKIFLNLNIQLCIRYYLYRLTFWWGCKSF